MNGITKIVFTTTLMLASLTGCGGGGGKTNPAPPTSGIWISATVITQQSPTGVGVVHKASAYVNQSSILGAPITNATVTINGVTLPYLPNALQFMADVVPDSAGKFNLVVNAKGLTFSAVQDAPDSLPVMSVPNFLIAAAPNTISWIPNVSARGLTPVTYYLALVAGVGIRPAFEANVTGNSATVPANYLAANVNYCVNLNARYNSQLIANAEPGGDFQILAVPTAVCKSAM